MSKLSELEHSELLKLCEGVSRAHAQVFSQKRPKMQFSKKICVFGMMLVTATIAANIGLSLLNCATLSDVTMTVVTTFGGFATGGYFALSGVRDCSKNKHQQAEPAPGSHAERSGDYATNMQNEEGTYENG